MNQLITSVTTQNNIDRLDQWVSHVLLDQWLPNIWPEDYSFSAESLYQTNPHRTLVSCRQIFVLSRLMQRYVTKASKHSNQLQSIAFHLHEHFFNQNLGGWDYSILESGKSYDDTRDLYTYAFVIFAYAELSLFYKNDFYQQFAKNTWEAVVQKFKAEPFLFNSKLSSDFSKIISPPNQNSHMHLFEGLLACYEFDGSLEQPLKELLKKVKQTFYCEQNNAILELPLGSENNELQPGHQYEWAYLLLRASQLKLQINDVFSKEDILCLLKPRISLNEYLLPLSLTPDGTTVLDASHRIWTQCEWVKALYIAITTWGESSETEWISNTLEHALEHLLTKYLHETGWYEMIDDQGQVIRDDQPTSTPYHIVSCLETLRKK